MSFQAGTYQARAVGIQYGTTSKGNDQIVVELEITSEGPHKGDHVSSFLIFSDASAQYSIDRLRALGWKGDDLASLCKPGSEDPAFDTVPARIAIKFEIYDGKEQMKVEIYTGGGRVELANAMDDKGKRAFAARFKALASAARPAGNAGASAATDFPYGANEPARSGVKL